MRRAMPFCSLAGLVLQLTTMRLLGIFQHPWRSQRIDTTQAWLRFLDEEESQKSHGEAELLRHRRKTRLRRRLIQKPGVSVEGCDW